jgi:hypothetical protein
VLEEFRRELLGVDWGRTAEAVEAFIAEKVDGAGVRGVVLGLSGGVDSSVVATLCVRALSPDRVLGLVMPAEFTPNPGCSGRGDTGQKPRHRDGLRPDKGCCRRLRSGLGCRAL